MKKQCIAMLLAGGQGSRLYALTRDMAKPGIPFGGKYRIIDFPLSNCANSGIDVVGVLTQYRPQQLNSYIGSGAAWDLDGGDGGAFILPPYRSGGGESGWFKGTADAIYQNIGFVDLYDPEYVLILSGDHIYKMDYSDMLAVHKQNQADCTIAVIRVPMEEASRFGIMTVDEASGAICKFTEKPKEPDSDLASMGIYIFSWKKLRSYLVADAAAPDSENDFGKNIIPRMLAAGERLVPYYFEGYWRDVGTISSFWDANMDILSSQINLYDSNWPILANSPRRFPQYVGPNAMIDHSIVTEGSEVYGLVQNSVLSVSVVVEEGATVRYSTLMPGARVCAGALVEYAIIGENTVVERNAHVGSQPDGSPDWAVATCGPNITVRAGSVVPPGAMIYSSEEVPQ
ncbi:MAG: glucose-1-phosphate adenylyltransferase [Oscillospiraceae bacterium]|nr:glucose-1-phosphate adenylyltransferase [Oscillospiraceae bacterium]